MAVPPRPRAGMLDRGDALRSRDLAPGSVVLGRYTVQKVLGRGGMATVYMAKHQQTERLVALKLLDPEISRDPSYVERFRREARAAGRIRSDYVVAIYDLDAEVGGGLVLVMEYLEGQTVQQALRAGRMPIQRVLSFGRHLLEGLSAAHDSSVIHRDLKPANLFIERSSTGSEKCKILDFGISKLADASQQELTRDGQTLGTVAYMAPEQIRGKASSTDPRVDLYAAGVTLFIMLTGKRPIDADDPVQLLAAVLENPPLTLAQAAGMAFPQPLETFIAKALQKDSTYRYQTALEMRDALLEAGRALGHESTGALSLPNGGGPAPVARNPGEPTPSPGVSGVVPTNSARSSTKMGVASPAAGGPRPTMMGVGTAGAQPPMNPMRAPSSPGVQPGGPPPMPGSPHRGPSFHGGPGLPGGPPPMQSSSSHSQPGRPSPSGPFPPQNVPYSNTIPSPEPASAEATLMDPYGAGDNNLLGMPPSPMSPPGASGDSTANIATRPRRSNVMTIALAGIGSLAIIAAIAIVATRQPAATTTSPATPIRPVPPVVVPTTAAPVIVAPAAVSPMPQAIAAPPVAPPVVIAPAPAPAVVAAPPPAQAPVVRAAPQPVAQAAPPPAQPAPQPVQAQPASEPVHHHSSGTSANGTTGNGSQSAAATTTTTTPARTTGSTPRRGRVRSRGIVEEAPF